jgi:uncharacterized membrane protein YfcA
LGPITIALLAVLGLLAGCLGGMFGVGGGIIVVPILILGFGLDARHAVGTSLVMIIFTALSGTLAYQRQKRIDWRVGLADALVTVPGASIGAYATQFFSSRNLALIFGIIMFLIAGAMIRRSLRKTSPKIERATDRKTTLKATWRRSIIDSGGNVFEYDAQMLPGLLLLFAGGLAAGFLGIGGGLIAVPILTALIGLPIHIAVATSMLTMIFTSISGVTTHVMLGNVQVEYAIPLVVGIVIGAQLGARTAKRLKSVNLERAFAALIIVIAVVLIITRL